MEIKIKCHHTGRRPRCGGKFSARDLFVVICEAMSDLHCD